MALAVSVVAVMACGEGRDLQTEVSAFLTSYSEQAQRLGTAWNEAEWASNTRIIEGDGANADATQRANSEFLAFVGSIENIEAIQAYLERGNELTSIQRLQLEKMLAGAAAGPQTIPETVAERIIAETAQNEALYGFEFMLDGRAVTPNDLDAILTTSSDLAERQAAWEASKQVGPVLKDGLLKLRDLRNATVQELGYSDFFEYQVSDYGMTTDEMLQLTNLLVDQLRPLYRELHTWARYTLAERYGQEVPDLIPAHWLPNRWAQNWSALVTVEGFDVDGALENQTAEWIMEQGEAFYVSLGFEELPETFWELSSLYPLPEGAEYKKNTHASAWHLDLEGDVRSLMSVIPDAYWYETVHHELGHIYYYQSYSRPEIPLVLREGANRAYHEAIGSQIGLAASQRRFLVNRGLITEDAGYDAIAQLLSEALGHVVLIPWAAGVMTEFEKALYQDQLPASELNAKWWELVARYQGVAPPTPRGEEYADALTKTHINDDPAQYYDYALAEALLFQLHRHVATEILDQDPHDTDYFGSTETGDFLRDLMAPGSSRPWREVLRETTGSALDGQAMVEYFQPLYEWLVEDNRGRTHTLPPRS